MGKCVEFPENTTREEMLKQVFDACDVDKTGSLTLAEYEHLQEESKDEAVIAAMKKSFDAMDKAGKGWSARPKDHKLTFKEFEEGVLAAHKDDDDAAFAQCAGTMLWYAQHAPAAI